MEKRQFVEGIGVVSKFFGMEWPVDAINAAYEQVSNEAVEALKAAHKRVYLEFTPRPQPAICKIVAIINEEGKKLRMQQGAAIESEWNNQKRGAGQDARKFFDKEKSSKHAKESIFLVVERMEGRMNDNQYLACLDRMERKYPGVGWDTVADEERLRPAREALQTCGSD